MFCQVVVLKKMNFFVKININISKNSKRQKIYQIFNNSVAIFLNLPFNGISNTFLPGNV